MTAEPLDPHFLDIVPGLGWPATTAEDTIVSATVPAPVGWQGDVPRETSPIQEMPAS